MPRHDPNHDTGKIIRFVHLHKRTGKRGRRYPFCGKRWGYVVDADKVGPLGPYLPRLHRCGCGGYRCLTGRKPRR